MKKYRRIGEGSMVSGVCSGLEQYTGIDFNPMIPAQLKGIETTRSTLAEWQ